MRETDLPAPPEPGWPAILVHGIWDRGAVFAALAARLADAGWQPHALDLNPNTGHAPLETLAEQVVAFANERVGRGQPFDLVGHSMGGLVARYVVQRLDEARRVRKLVTLAAPHRGTLAAYLHRSVGARQMRPGSRFLCDLNARCEEELADVDFWSLYTPVDLMIVPASSSALLPDCCSSVPVPLHAWMVSDERVLREVLQRLGDA